MLKLFVKTLRILLPALMIMGATAALAAPPAPSATPRPVREVIAEAVVAPTADEQVEMILSLSGKATRETVDWFEKWKVGSIFIHEADDGSTTAVLLTGEKDAEDSFATVKLADGSPMLAADGTPVRIDPMAVDFADTSSKLRRAMKAVSDTVALSDPDLTTRVRAIRDFAIGQKQENLPALLALQETEQESDARRALEESIAIIRLRSSDPAEQVAACKTLGRLGSIPARDTIKSVLAEAEATGNKPVAAAARQAITAIDSHISTVDAVGTLFRGVSLGSVLLVVAIGLAITFGLMGIINMAHGEFIAVGAYTAYVTEQIFTKGLNLSPFGKSMSVAGMKMGEKGIDLYFIAALPLSFLVAALVGVLLERSVIRFLYKRPLESLLATWGISLVMQQLLKFTFGSNNVQVTSPSWLSGSWIVNDVLFGWNRVFVIGFAILIIAITWLVLNKTSLGLLIRAVMQNRNMAACMGVRTERVNTMTFAFGCGLAGLAGAFLSQLGSVGPAMGQLYIVDSFMTVVVGGVGNIMGTVISAFGIGMADQSLQQYLGNPVIGKILVLGAIILFLQWRPAGLFVTRSRSLD